MSSPTSRPASASALPSALPVRGRDEANPEFGRLPPEARVRAAAAALERNGMTVVLARDRSEARKAVLERVPDGAEVLDATSRTLKDLGLSETLNDPHRFRPVRSRLAELQKEGKAQEMRRLGASPDVVVGSVHAITEDGQAVIASATGSQLASYVYGAGRVVWVVGAQKVVPDLDEAFRRVREYSFPLENARAKEAYGQGSAVSKVLVVNREPVPGRTTVVLVADTLGF